MRRSIKVLFNSDFELEHKNDKGVYSIYFLGTDKFYIGSTNSKGGFHSRWHWHICALRSNKHANSILQHTYNKYGESVLRLKIVEICNNTNEYTLEREQFYIDSLKPTINVNQTATGCTFPEGWISPTAKPVLQYDLEGNFVKEYVSMNEAKRFVKADIIQSLQNVNKCSTQAGGFQWRLKENNDFPLKISPYKYSQEITILCYNSNGDFYKEYSSMQKASQELNIDVGNISRVVNGLMRSCNGYFFKEKVSDNYPMHIDDMLRLHKNQLNIDIEDLETSKIYHFNSLRQIPKDLICRCSLQPYLKKGLREFIFKKRDTKKQYKIKIQNYNEV